MKERLLEFLRIENKSSAQLAEEIGVQASGISHILSGRNNPSLDFVLKMLERYEFLSTEWLLFGKGSMYKESRMQTLFDELHIDKEINGPAGSVSARPEISKQVDSGDTKLRASISSDIGKSSKSAISRIVLFFDDNSFEEYSPKDSHENIQRRFII